MTIRSKKGLFSAFLVSIILITFLCSAHAAQKPVEGYVYDGSGMPLKDASLKLFMRFEYGSNGITCLTYPTVVTDSRGYFITNLGNLRIFGNNYPCEDRWKKGDVIGLIANGFFAMPPASEKDYIVPSGLSIDSESGATLNAGKVYITTEKFEPLFSELNLAKMKITSLEHRINLDSRNIVFDAKAYNPNNIEIDDALLKIVITKKNDKNSIVGVVEQPFSVSSLGESEVQAIWNIEGIDYGSYSYNAILYTPTMDHDRVLDKDLELKPLLGLLNLQNAVMLIMGILIIILIIILFRSKRDIKKQKKR